ncbi:unnamed protein product [Danaus chrysippus]|uniref:(African queen) hypothetical protein n=1 Tax=Danaus chrysippus TaxID=151541 RepID=A0A8J2R6P4_9NEOP|nr:unnamed protein product [Danaus chrysippus]
MRRIIKREQSPEAGCMRACVCVCVCIRPCQCECEGVPSRCSRENCVRCACTAATELTQGRLAGRQRGPHRRLSPATRLVTLTRSSND